MIVRGHVILVFTENWCLKMFPCWHLIPPLSFKRFVLLFFELIFISWVFEMVDSLLMSCFIKAVFLFQKNKQTKTLVILFKFPNLTGGFLSPSWCRRTFQRVLGDFYPVRTIFWFYITGGGGWLMWNNKI